MKKTSIAIRGDVWRRFRSANLLDGHESGEVLAQLIEEHLKKREHKEGKRNGPR